MSRERSDGGGLSLPTLLISGLSAAGAATLVPLVWERGTLFATAMTPVIVALVAEALRRPAERISAVAPRVARRTATGAAVRRSDPAAAATRRPESVGARGEGPERLRPGAGQPGAPPRDGDPFGLRAARRRPVHVRLAVATGLLAFLIAGVILTVSELALFGGSVSGQRGRTTLVGGSEREPRRQAPAAPAATAAPAAPETTPAPSGEGTATPSPTPTPTTTAPATEPTPQPTP